MIRETNPRLPLWAKILFETPELVRELLWQGKFPFFRALFIDLITCLVNRLDVLVLKPSSFLLSIQRVFTDLLEWINENWKKNQA